MSCEYLPFVIKADIMILYSPAKLNLYLDILNKRPDGYHNICTIFERIALFDKIILAPSKDGKIIIKSDSRDIPGDSRNIVYKAALLLKNDFNIPAGVDIEIKKTIPVGAGLGGGSSNAASVLLGLNEFWGLNLSRKNLLRYAEKLGSDTAFFLYNSPYALGTGRGERILPLSNFRRKLWHVLAVPDLKVSTRKIYRAFDNFKAKEKYSRPQLARRQLLRQAIDSLSGILFNRLEGVTFRRYPEVKKIKDGFKKHGLNKVLMSGSGSAVFGIVKSRKEGLRAAKFFKGFKGLRVFVIATAKSAK